MYNYIFKNKSFIHNIINFVVWYFAVFIITYVKKLIRQNIQEYMTNRTYDQSSKSKDRTFDICEPKFLCIPEHSMHINTPRFKLAQSGSKN